MASSNSISLLSEEAAELGRKALKVTLSVHPCVAFVKHPNTRNRKCPDVTWKWTELINPAEVESLTALSWLEIESWLRGK